MKQRKICSFISVLLALILITGCGAPIEKTSETQNSELAISFVDDDGEEHEPGDPYELNEKNFCCGHELKYEKKSKTFICESCGEKYTAE